MRLSLLIVLSAALLANLAQSADPIAAAPTTSADQAAPASPVYRTDHGDASLPWYQLTPGVFPPIDAAHEYGGELIEVDHVNRKGRLRPDRDDSQRRGEWDLARPFELVSFGSLAYHGAPAALKHIPLGTHLHGAFFADPLPPKAKPDAKVHFTRALRLEDDFSYFTRQGWHWRIDAVALDVGTITATVIGRDEQAQPGKPTTFVIHPSTRVWKGRGFGSLSDLAAEQRVLINLTVCTLKGPGRCTDIWLDDESRTAAKERQLELHRLHEREHGLAGWVESVDNQAGTMRVALFGGFDPTLLEAFVVNESCAAAVAEDSLRTYDQINDVKRGPILKIDRVEPAGAGDSGVRIELKPSNLLEGYRPLRIVRLFATSWKVDDLPREEKLY